MWILTNKRLPLIVDFTNKRIICKLWGINIFIFVIIFISIIISWLLLLLLLTFVSTHICLNLVTNAVVTSEIKLKQNNVLFQWNCFVSGSFQHVHMWNKTLKQNKSRRGLFVNQKTSLREAWSCHNIYVIFDVMLWQHGRQRCWWGVGWGCSVRNRHCCSCRYCHC